MKPVGKKIMVKAHLNQKEAINIKGQDGKTIQLWLGTKFRENHRERNPVICEILENNTEYNYLRKGDKILVHHNYLGEWESNTYCIEYDRQNDVGIFSIPAGRQIFAKLMEDGSLQAVCHNIICERLKNPIKSSIIIIPDTVKQEFNDRVKVINVSPETDGISPNDTVLILDKSDYQIIYNFNGEERTAIKIWNEEVIGILKEPKLETA